MTDSQTWLANLLPNRELKHWIGITASVAPQIVFIGILIHVWLFPMEWDDGQWVSHGVLIIVAEFFLLHSGVFMAGIALEKKAMTRFNAFMILFLFYGGFTAFIAHAAEDPNLMWIFGGVMLGRFVALVVAVDEGSTHLAERSVWGGMLYVLLVPLSIFLPIPELGIEPPIARAAFSEGSNGVWVKEPERGFFMAVAYFTIMVGLELFWFGRPERDGPEIDWDKATS